LFFSTLAKTQQQATQMSFFFMLPNVLLAGFTLLVALTSLRLSEKLV
jgi:hypothetical protein